jgi:HK97 family phage prohead protease
MPWEQTENEIRHRERDPGDFQEGSFRRIPFKRSKPRVFAVIGHLKGETTTTVQSLRFPKDDGWTMEKAKAWHKDHYKKAFEDWSAQILGPIETKILPLDLRELSEQGTFLGLSAVYNTRDRIGDLIMPGAFTKTLAENGGKYPLFYGHRVNIGVSEVRDSVDGLLTKGLLNLEKAAARDVYSDLKFYRDKGVRLGMSIGFLPVPGKVEFKADGRVLHELMLFENTLTELPLHPNALVQSIKSMDEAEEISELLLDVKAGRAISAERAQRLREIAQQILALLDEAGATTSDDEAATKSIEPAFDHSALTQFRDLLKEVLKWN